MVRTNLLRIDLGVSGKASRFWTRSPKLRGVSAGMLGPRRSQIVKKNSSTIGRLVEVNAGSTFRTFRVRNDITRKVSPLEIPEIVSVVIRRENPRATSATSESGAGIPISSPPAGAIWRMVPSVTHETSLIFPGDAPGERFKWREVTHTVALCRCRRKPQLGWRSV